MDKKNNAVIHGLATFGFIVVVYVLAVINGGAMPYQLSDVVIRAFVVGCIVFVISALFSRFDK